MSPGFYRREAERTRRLVADQTDSGTVQQLRRLAAEYDDLADDLERSQLHRERASFEPRPT
jgi:hypothetical protein